MNIYCSVSETTREKIYGTINVGPVGDPNILADDKM